jgi:uncharacterized membrane protein YbhN (UPF0104 family)
VARSGTPHLADALRLLPVGKGSRRSLFGFALTTGCLVGAALVARGRVEASAGDLLDARGLPLLVAAVCAPLVPAATAGAWRSVLVSRGVPLGAAEAWGCYGLGSVVNTFLPGRAGDALRIELFSRRLNEQGRRWLACGVSAAVGLAQSIVFGCVLGLGSLLGALPAWTLAPALALPAATWGAGRLALRRRPGARVACLATAATLAPLAWSRLLAWVAAAALARLLLVVAVLTALDVPQALTVALVAVCGLAVGNALPFAPGGVGVAAATMSVALGHAGVPASAAVAAAMSFHAFETAASLLFGATGWLLLRLAEPRAPYAAAGIRVA